MTAPESLIAMKPCVNRTGGWVYMAASRVRATVSSATHAVVRDDVLCEILQAKLPVITLIRERLK